VENVGKWVLAVGSWLVSYLFGGWSGVLGVLLVFVVLDYLTGVVAAGSYGGLKSKIGLIGIARKVFIFAMVALGTWSMVSWETAICSRKRCLFLYREGAPIHH
jgi:toxin secretion/phage lysis holin